MFFFAVQPPGAHRAKPMSKTEFVQLQLCRYLTGVVVYASASHRAERICITAVRICATGFCKIIAHVRVSQAAAGEKRTTSSLVTQEAQTPQHLYDAYGWAVTSAQYYTQWQSGATCATL